MTLNRYWNSTGKTCTLKDRCTPSQQRRVTRREHQHGLGDMQARLELSPDAMQIGVARSSIHSGPSNPVRGDALPDKKLARVKTDMSLHVLAYTSND
jgi:hypothetical protein